MNVLVAGGTGFLGSRLCRELAERGHDVTALARSPSGDDFPESVDVATGDVSAYDSVVGAVEARDAVVNLVALSPLFRPSGGERMHEEVHLRGTENLVRASEEGGVERFVQMSALGADPAGATYYLRAKGRAEQVVRDAELDWVILRPSVVFGEGGEFVRFTRLLAPPYFTPLPGGGRTRFQPIHVDDLVPMLADAVEEEAHVGETYELGGPEVLTLADVARLAHRAEGRPVNVVPVPMALAKVGLALLDAVPGAPMGMDQFRSLRLDNTVADNDVTAFGVEPDALTTLADYLNVKKNTGNI